MPEYKKAQEKLATEVEAEELTVEDVQKLVDDVNLKSISAEEEAALVEAIEKAATAGNQVTTLQALKDAGIERVNSAWIVEYIEGLDTDSDDTIDIVGLDTVDADSDDLEVVQDIINDINDELVTKNITTTGIDKEKLTKSKDLIETYATVDEDGNFVTTQFKEDLENISIQLALVEVLEATTPTAFKNKLSALATLVDNTSVLDMDDYVDANGKAYIQALKDAPDADKDTVAKVEGILFSNVDPGDGSVKDNVNKVEASKLVGKVTGANTADELLTALKNLGVKQVAETNKDAYFTYDADSPADGADYKNITDKDDAQSFVDEVNLSEVQNANENTIIAKLNVFGIDNVIAENAKAYVNDLVVPSVGATNKDTVENIKNAVATVNKQVIVDAQVEAINKADDVATVKAALDALANVNEAAGYLSVRSSDRDFVAAYVLEYRPTAGYDDEADIQAVIGADNTSTFNPGDGSTVDASIKAHSDALDGINTLNFGSTVTEVVTALDAMLDEDFSALSNTEKANKAEEFHDKLTFNDAGTEVSPKFRSLAEVKELLWN